MQSTHALALLLATAFGTACDNLPPIEPSPPNSRPVAAFTSSCALLVCTFTDSSSDADGQVVARSWDFGDQPGSPWDYDSRGVSASSEDVQDTQHTYVAPDTYIVLLTVTDDDGAENSVAKMVRVSMK